MSWFLIGGDLYTAYTVIAVPALVYASGAMGLFAIPYTILIYPLLYLTFPRLWAVTHKHGYITAADYVCGRYGSRWLALAVAITGIVATMPYIALQLVGMEKVIQALGFSNFNIAITIAFIILALYTYSSGLRAPAMIAFVKDIMIYIFVVAAVIDRAAEARRLRRHLRQSRGRARREGRRHRQARRHPAAKARSSCPSRRWRSARRWRFSCIRIR